MEEIFNEAAKLIFKG